MASRHVCGRVPVTASEPLLGLGTRVDVDGRSFLVATLANRNGGNGAWEAAGDLREGMGVASADREVPECSSEGSLVDVDPLAFSVLRRACSVADGNNFYGEGLRSRDHDNSVQYGREACHAVLALEGLNVVPEDLAVASLVGRTARDVVRPGDSPLGDPRDALARVLARLLADGAQDLDAARASLDDVAARTRALLDAAEATSAPRPHAEVPPDP